MIWALAIYWALCATLAVYANWNGTQTFRPALRILCYAWQVAVAPFVVPYCFAESFFIPIWKDVWAELRLLVADWLTWQAFKLRHRKK